MTAHLSVPALDPTGLPATRSRTIIEGVLRGEMGFRGAVISDSLLMGGAEPGQRPICVDAVAAGVDLLLDPQDAEADLDALLAAVGSGDLPEARLREAAQRVAALHRHVAERVGADDGAGVGTEAHRRVAASVAREAVSVVKGEPALDADAPLLAVMIRPTHTHLDPDEQPLGAALRARFPHVTYAEVGPEASQDELSAIRERATQPANRSSPSPRLLIAAVSKPSAWRAAGLPDWQEAFVSELCQTQPSILVALGNPRVLHTFDACAHQLVTYSDVPASQLALAEFLAERAVADPRPQPSVS
jgi:beta-N-acetylhexosaminidase